MAYRELAIRVLGDLLSRREDITGAYLEGSYCNGTLTSNSDLDLRIVLDSGAEVGRFFTSYDQTPVDCILLPRDLYDFEGAETIRHLS